MLTPESVTVPLVVFVRVAPTPANFALMLPLATAKLVAVSVPLPVILPSVNVTSPTVSLLPAIANVPPLIVMVLVSESTLLVPKANVPALMVVRPV